VYYHVRITQKSSSAHDETKLDLTEENLLERFLQPYELGQPILINGKTIPSDDIERFRITRSRESSERLIAAVKAKERESSVVFFGGPSYQWQAADSAEDVTDEFIRGPAGYRAEQISKKKSPTNRAHSRRSDAKGRRPKRSLSFMATIMHSRPTSKFSFMILVLNLLCYIGNQTEGGL